MKKNLLIFASTFPRWAGDEEIPQFIFELEDAWFELFAVVL